MEVRALSTLIYLPGKAFTIMIAIGKTLDYGVNLRFLAHDHKKADLPD